MSLNCFFGIEVKPDGIPVIPIIPPHSSLVITQCAVTSVCAPAKHLSTAATTIETNNVNSNESSVNNYDKPKKATLGGPVTLYVQSHEIPTRFAVCTLDPSHGVTFCPLQLIFSKHAALTLLTESTHKNNAIERTKDNDAKGKKSNKETNSKAKESLSNSKVLSSTVEENTWYPTVHLTGYYEAEEEEEDDDDDEEDEEKMEGSSEEEEEEFYGRGGHNRRHYHQEVYEDDDDNVHDEVWNKKRKSKPSEKRGRELTSYKDQETQRSNHTKKNTKTSKVHTHEKHAAKSQKESKQSKRIREALLKAEEKS